MIIGGCSTIRCTHGRGSLALRMTVAWAARIVATRLEGLAVRAASTIEGEH